MVDCNTKCGNKIIREIILPPPDGNISYLCSMQICVFFFYCLPRLFLINFIKPFSSWRLPISFAGMWNTLPDCCRVPFRSIPVRSSWITSPSSVFQLSSLMAVVVPFSKYAHFFFFFRNNPNVTLRLLSTFIIGWVKKNKKKTGLPGQRSSTHIVHLQLARQRSPLYHVTGRTRAGASRRHPG